MKQGFLWFDNDRKKSIESKVTEAIRRYRAKFGTDPQVCYLSPADATKPVGGKIRVIGSQAVLPNHIWLEID